MRHPWIVGLALLLAFAAGYLAGSRMPAARAQEAAVKIDRVKANPVKAEEGEYKDVIYRRIKYDTNVEIRQVVDQDKKVVCFAWSEGAGPSGLSCVKFGN